MNEKKNSNYQLQLYRDGKWEDAIGVTLKFSVANKMLELYNKDKSPALPEARIEPVPNLPLGFRFQLPGLRHGTIFDLDMVITYAYHNTEEWKYHCGRIIGQKGVHPILAPYDKSPDIHKTYGDLIYVDYCTSTEEEIRKEML